MIRLTLSPIDAYQHVSVDGHLRRIKSDVSVLLQQDIIDSLPRSFLDNLINNNDNPVDTSSMSDEDLISTCKSRYLQTPSELKAWSKALDTNSNYIKSYLASLKKNKPVNSSDNSSDTSSD
nr:hypothetical protein IXTSGTPV_IXTSGTPV_CDS_0008 [Microvirus sp.]